MKTAWGDLFIRERDGDTFTVEDTETGEVTELTYQHLTHISLSNFAEKHGSGWGD